MKSISSLTIFKALSLLCCIFSLSANALELSATVDRNKISEDESLLLTVRIDEQVGFGSPDFELIKKDWDIVNEQRSNQFRSINGRSEGWTEWTLVLAPRHTGTLFIPSLNFKSSFSNAIEVAVNPLGSATANESRDIFAEVTPEKKSLYVQEQLVISIKLHTAVDLREVSIEDDLVMDDALVERVAETTYRKQINGRTYKVAEITYVVYPQKSGELSIPALSWNAVVANRQWSNDPFLTPRGTLKRIRSAPFTITVNAKPTSYTGDAWLPAKSVSLEQHWSSDPSRFVVGEPITRTITLSATGLSAAQLPPIPDTPVSGVKFYNDQPQFDERKSSAGIEGLRIESQAIVPNESGNMTLPAIVVTWWDTTQNKQRTTSLPEQPISIAPASITRSAPSLSTPQFLADGSTISDTQSVALSGDTSIPLWIIISNTITACLALLFFIAWIRVRRSSVRPGGEENLLHENSVRTVNQAFANVRKACSTNDPQATRVALGQWGKEYWQLSHVVSLQDIAERCQSSDITKELEGLDKILYGNQASNGWNGKNLWQVLVSFKQQDQKAKTATKDNALPPLYPVA